MDDLMPAGPVLVCAATVRELEACCGRAILGEAEAGKGVILAVTGVGIPLTLARLLPLASRLRPGLIVNVGLGGAYPGSHLRVGDLVAGESEVFGDLGLELPGPEAFVPMREQAWADSVYRWPLSLVVDPLVVPGQPDGPDASPVKVGKGCTVNACTGREETGRRRRELFGADFESMEGAAVALAGRQLGIAVCELRAISNLASTRDMRPENIERALENLGAYMRPWLGRLGHAG